MTKVLSVRKLPKEVYCKIESSDDEFYFDSLNTNFDIESDSGCFVNIYTRDSGSDIVQVNNITSCK